MEANWSEGIHYWDSEMKPWGMEKIQIVDVGASECLLELSKIPYFFLLISASHDSNALIFPSLYH